MKKHFTSAGFKTAFVVAVFALSIFVGPFSASADYGVNYTYDWGSNDYGYYNDTTYDWGSNSYSSTYDWGSNDYGYSTDYGVNYGYDWGSNDYGYYNDSTYDWGSNDYGYYNDTTYDWGSNDYPYYGGYNTGVWTGDTNTGVWTGDYNTGTWVGDYNTGTWDGGYGYDWGSNDYVYYNDYNNGGYYTQPYYGGYGGGYSSYPVYGGSYSYWYDNNDYYYYDRPSRPSYDEPRCALEVSDKTPDEGDYVTLSWTITDADHATLTGFGSVSPRSGSERIRVTDDRTFRLSVDGRGGSDDCTVAVRVNEDRNPPRNTSLSCELDASDKSIEEGDTTTLEWDTRGDVRSARINQGIGSVDEDGGTERVRPTRTTTYRLTVEDRDGDEEECDVTVRVDEDTVAPPPDVPLVYLSQLPYTGAADTMTYWLLLITGSGVAGYMLFYRAIPFALARVKALKYETTTQDEKSVAEGETVPENVTRQDVRAFVSALAEGDVHSAREFARTGGAVLFAETAVVLDDVVRSREHGTTADPMISSLTKEWDGEKFAKLIESFVDAKETDSTLDEALGA